MDQGPNHLEEERQRFYLFLEKERSLERWGLGGSNSPVTFPALPAMVSLTLTSHGTKLPVHTHALPGNLEDTKPEAEDP